MIVMKFGGSSLATAERIGRCIGIVRRSADRSPVVVVSALGRTTDMLIHAADRAVAGGPDACDVAGAHLDISEGLGIDAGTVEPLLARLRAVLEGVSLLRELTPRTLDHVMSFGERMAARMMAAAMNGEGIPAVAVDSFDIGMLTDSKHGGATPLPGIEPAIREHMSRIGGDRVPVVTGFLGRDAKGEITTLGRSGSDFTASIIGGALEAEEVQIWKDVSGVMTCDPSVDPGARNLPVLSFDEASELAYFGAEVLHPNTLVPAMRKRIPVRVLDTTRPDDAGTLVVADPVRTDRIAKSIVYKEDVCLVSIASPRIMSAVALLSSAFGVLDRLEVPIHMATTSESTVSMVTGSRPDEDRIVAACAELAAMGDVRVERQKAIVCVVGDELRGKAGVLGRIFGALESHGIKARMVSQSASEINVACLVENRQVEPAVRALHALIVGA